MPKFSPVAVSSLYRFLYQQIQKFLVGDESVFVSGDSGGRGLALKPGVEFHLYLSSAPCGDARRVGLHEASGEETEDAGEDRPKRTAGQLRAKMESGEGTEPMQTSDADMQTTNAGPLLMSCSDKLARMNVLGVQGQICSDKVLYLLSNVVYGRHSEAIPTPYTFDCKKTLAGMQE